MVGDLGTAFGPACIALQHILDIRRTSATLVYPSTQEKAPHTLTCNKCEAWILGRRNWTRTNAVRKL